MTTARQFPDREPEPIRRSDLPPTRPAEWEFHTWFPHPDGGGDMVRGQRQRGVQVRRRVSYGDWEPVHPDRWTDEPTGQETSAATEATIQPEYRALLARLNEEQAHYAEAAARTRIDECVISHSSKAHAFKIAAAHLLAAFEGPEAANAYMRDGGKPPAQGAFVPPPPGSTEEHLPADVLALIDPPPYLSTACETAQLLEQAMAEHPDRQAGLGEWARRMHQRCRLNNKFTGRLCSCDHHQRQPV